MDWATVATVGITAASTLAAGFLGGWLQGRNQERADRRQQRERAAAVLAEVRALLTDANPERLGINANEEIFTQMFTDLNDRFQQIRIPLLTVGIGHPSEEVRGLAVALETALSNSLVSANRFVRFLLGMRSTEFQETATRDYEEARRLVGQLGEAIRT
jgi:hypothetical protein